MSYTGPRALLEAAFALGLLGLVLLLAGGLGWKLLRTGTFGFIMEPDPGPRA